MRADGHVVDAWATFVADNDLDRCNGFEEMSDAIATLAEQHAAPRPFPIVALVGSTLFKQEYDAQARRLTMQGKVALGVDVRKSKDWCDEDVTAEIVDMLDAMKRAHIDMADEVLVINVGGYVGESTAAHIAYAHEQGKPVSYLEAG